jgi:hypothetical protein
MWNKKALFYRKHDTVHRKQGNNLLLKLFVMITIRHCMCVHCVVNMEVLKMLGKDSDGEDGLSTGVNSEPAYIADTT